MYKVLFLHYFPKAASGRCRLIMNWTRFGLPCVRALKLNMFTGQCKIGNVVQMTRESAATADRCHFDCRGYLIPCLMIVGFPQIEVEAVRSQPTASDIISSSFHYFWHCCLDHWENTFNHYTYRYGANRTTSIWGKPRISAPFISSTPKFL